MILLFSGLKIHWMAGVIALFYYDAYSSRQYPADRAPPCLYTLLVAYLSTRVDFKMLKLAVSPCLQASRNCLAIALDAVSFFYATAIVFRRKKRSMHSVPIRAWNGFCINTRPTVYIGYWPAGVKSVDAARARDRAVDSRQWLCWQARRRHSDGSDNSAK